MPTKVKISEVKPNPNNPRIIKDEKFKKLVQSLKDLPEMAEVRPIVVNTDMIVLGGNMRLKAMKEAGWKDVPVEVVDWDEDKQRQFIIKDNVGFGEWDWDMLANEWDADILGEWGLDVWKASNVNLDDFFSEDNSSEPSETKKTIVLEYTDSEYDEVIEAFKKHAGSKEQVVFKLLGL